MPDVAHTFGQDLQASANGDLATSDSVELSQEMVLRRLLTNPGDYIWHPDYGAGLPKMVGKPVDVAQVTRIIQSQMALEASVVQNPSPMIQVSSIPNGMFVEIDYIESDSQLPAYLGFPVS